MGNKERWDAYVEFAQDYLRTGNLNADEIIFKREICSN